LHEKIQSLEKELSDMRSSHNPEGDSRSDISCAVLLDSIQEPVWAVDRTSSVIIANGAFKKVFLDVCGIDFSIGDNFIRFLPVDLQELWGGFIERVFRGENFSTEQEFTAGETTQYYEFIFNPIELKNDEINGVAIMGREITERKKTDMKIRDNERRFRSLVQNSNDIIFILTADGTIRYISPSVETILGYSAADITDTDISMYVHPEDSDAINAHLVETAAETGTNKSFRCRFRRSEGSFAYVEGISSNHADDEFIRGIVVNVRDASDRIGIEEALLESEKRYKSIIEDLPRMICRFLPDGTLTFVNGNYCSALKRTAGELLGKNLLAVLPENERTAVQEQFRSLNPSQPVISYEHTVLLPNGETRRHRWTSRAILNPDGSVAECQAIGEDISSEK
jgi:PAS domain S-box-containing protein